MAGDAGRQAEAVPDAGHSPAIEQPAATARLLVDFFHDREGYGPAWRFVRSGQRTGIIAGATFSSSSPIGASAAFTCGVYATIETPARPPSVPEPPVVARRARLRRANRPTPRRCVVVGTAQPNRGHTEIAAVHLLEREPESREVAVRHADQNDDRRVRAVPRSGSGCWTDRSGRRARQERRHRGGVTLLGFETHATGRRRARHRWELPRGAVRVAAPPAPGRRWRSAPQIPDNVARPVTRLGGSSVDERDRGRARSA